MTTALITGASSGLGAEFACQLARENYALILTARRKERLDSMAAEAKSLGAPAVRVIPCDLAQASGAEALHRQLAGEAAAVGYLINNAGFGTRGRFDRLALKREREQIDLNVTALVTLTRLFLPAMVERGRGTIINVASTAGFQPLPFMATYGATKAFVLSFSQALAGELRAAGVTVMALCPGPVRTGFQEVAGMDERGFPSFTFMDARTVVAQAIAAAKRGKPLHINGALNRAMIEAQRLIPRSLVTRIARAMLRKPGA